MQDVLEAIGRTIEAYRTMRSGRQGGTVEANAREGVQLRIYSEKPDKDRLTPDSGLLGRRPFRT
jgi:hypothetical protein